MKITYSHIDSQFRDAIELESARHVERLNRLLKRYPPDTAQLHCSMEKTPRRTEFGFVVNLTLTAGVLHATGYGGDVRTSVKAAFAELEVQVKKHQAKLRKDYVWKRKRDRGVLKVGELPTTS
jgi:ribosome-associated translation inhibitor RaiA